MQFLNTPFEVSFKVNQIIYNAIMMTDAVRTFLHVALIREVNFYTCPLRRRTNYSGSSSSTSKELAYPDQGTKFTGGRPSLGFNVPPKVNFTSIPNH